MKKILSVLLTIIVIFTLSGCGSKKEGVATAKVIPEKKIIKVGASPVT